MLIETLPNASVTIDGHKVPCKELRINLHPYHEGEFIFRKFKSSVIMIYRELSYSYQRGVLKRWTGYFDIEEVMELQLRMCRYRYTEQEMKDIVQAYKNLK